MTTMFSLYVIQHDIVTLNQIMNEIGGMVAQQGEQISKCNDINTCVCIIEYIVLKRPKLLLVYQGSY